MQGQTSKKSKKIAHPKRGGAKTKTTRKTDTNNDSKNILAKGTIDIDILALGVDRFGIEAFRPGQKDVIDNVFAGIDTLAIMPTGAGKSLCYQLPSLVLAGVTLVVSPLIALMKDQYDKLESLGVQVIRLDSTLTPKEEARSLARLESGERCIAYVTPERLADSRFRERLHGVQIALFVVDEAHCISQWGHDFRPAYLGLGEAVTAVGSPPVLALTATAPPKVKNDILAQLGIEDGSIIDVGLKRPNLRYHVFKARSERKKRQLLLELLGGQEGCGIIYAATVKTVDAVADFLIDSGVSCGRYHGRMRAKERDKVQTAFMQRGRPRIMVATNAFGLGVDKQNLRFVVHYNFPGSLESYYQEAGRAGRDGRPANCILLYQPEDKRIQSFFLGGRYPTPDQTTAVASALATLYADNPVPQTLKDIADYSETPAKKARVVLSFLKDVGFTNEVDGSQFVPTRKEPPSAEELANAAERYAAKRAQDQARLDSMLRYAKSKICRNRLLLTYFGYANGIGDHSTCGTCDNCLRVNREKVARTADNAVRSLASRRAAERSQTKAQTQKTSGTKTKAQTQKTSGTKTKASSKSKPAASGNSARRELLERLANGRKRRPTRERALKVARAEVKSPTGFTSGDLIAHTSFGEGEVVRISGDTIECFFPAVGEKLLKARFIKKIAR